LQSSVESVCLSSTAGGMEESRRVTALGEPDYKSALLVWIMPRSLTG
jgi:hypothetical protein